MKKKNAQSFKRADMLPFVKKQARRYGSEVLHNRAVPEERDGLKPVQRHIVWAAHKLNLTGDRFVKASKLSGDVMGNYHPHGSDAIDDAAAKLSKGHLIHPLLDGQGNWGKWNSKAGAFRYVEVRLSKFTQSVLLDPAYLAVAPVYPNYTGTEKIPECLPSLLPLLLIKGTAGIAYGVAVGIPSFELKGVIALTKAALKGKKITAKTCYKYLKPEFKWGGQCINTKQEMLSIFKTGSGRLRFMVDRKIDIHKNQYIITGLGMYFKWETVHSKVIEWPEVQQAYSVGLKGEIKLVIQFKRNAKVKNFVAQLDQLCSGGFNVSLNTVHRTVVDPESDELDFKFYQGNFPDFIQRWVEWRIDLEKRMLEYLIGSLNERVHRQDLLILAAKYAQRILALIQSKKFKAKADILKAIAKLLKVSVEDAETVWGMTIGRLSNLDQTEIQATKKRLLQEVADAKKRLRNPAQSAHDVTANLKW